jgi:ribonuclease Z
MDHFAGFDQLLRRLVGREKTLNVYGPAGMVDAVEHKLRAYTWNLVEGYDGNLTIRAVEIDSSGLLMSARFSGRSRFTRIESEAVQCDSGLLLNEPDLQVRAATLDHGTPVLAFALEERVQINVCRNKVELMGLAIGPWLRTFKDAVLRGVDDDFPINVAWGGGQSDNSPTIPIGLLKKEIMKTTRGRKIAYVVDCAFTDANQEKIVWLTRDADILFIEATFLDTDATVAAKRLHLTARQAGALARLAGAKRLVTLHYSPRYKGQGHLLTEEAQDAFLSG